tara:strand:+ start:592 stop:1095 length:504 start_codon:yes stop_codon:yes gene_type:complete
MYKKMGKKVIWYLEMINKNEFKPKTLPKDADVIKIGIPLPIINRFFYKEVGKLWYWTDRAKWNIDRWNDWVKRENLQTWILLYKGTPAGYFELETREKEVEIAFFGLLPEFIQKGLGGGFLSAAIKNAWEIKKTRVCVNTCSLDHRNALNNYKSRGFKIIREENVDF